MQLAKFHCTKNMHEEYIQECKTLHTCSGGQTFPKSTEIRNSVAFLAFFSVFFHPCFSLVAESVSE